MGGSTIIRLNIDFHSEYIAFCRVQSCEYARIMNIPILSRSAEYLPYFHPLSPCLYFVPSRASTLRVTRTCTVHSTGMGRMAVVQYQGPEELVVRTYYMAYG